MRCFSWAERRRVRGRKFAIRKTAIDRHVIPGRCVDVERSELCVHPSAVDLDVKLGVVVTCDFSHVDVRPDAPVLEHVDERSDGRERVRCEEWLTRDIKLVDENRLGCAVVRVADRQDVLPVALRVGGRAQPNRVRSKRRARRRRRRRVRWRNVCARIFVEYRSIYRKQVPVARQIRVGEHVVERVVVQNEVCVHQVCCVGDERPADRIVDL